MISPEVVFLIGMILLICAAIYGFTHPLRPSPPPATSTEQLTEFATICRETLPGSFVSYNVDIPLGNLDKETKNCDRLFSEKQKYIDDKAKAIKLRCSPYANTPLSQVPLKDSKVCAEYFNN